MKRRKDGRFERVITVNGKRKSFFSSATTEKAAARDIERQILQYNGSVERGPTFAEVADAYDVDCEKRVASKLLSETTYARYRAYIRRASDALGGLPIKQITVRDIELFLGKMARQQYTTKTITDQNSIVRQIFEHAAVVFDVRNDAFRYVRVPKGKASTRREALTDDQQKSVLDLIGAPFGTFAALLIYTGLRRGEMIGLRWRDIDFDAKTITVSRSVVFPENKPLIKDTKTAAGERTILLLDPLAEILRPLVGVPDDYILTGAELRGNSWYTRRWNEWQTATGMNVTPHQFRHTYATILYEAGVDELAAQKMMGHKDVATTHKIYTHVRDKHLEKNRERLSKFIESSSK